MKKALLVIFTVVALNLHAQKIARIYACKASIIYKPEDNQLRLCSESKGCPNYKFNSFLINTSLT